MHMGKKNKRRGTESLSSHFLLQSITKLKPCKFIQVCRHQVVGCGSNPDTRKRIQFILPLILILASQVDKAPVGVVVKDSSRLEGSELVRHFLIEPSAKGVKLKVSHGDGFWQRNGGADWFRKQSLRSLWMR